MCIGIIPNQLNLLVPRTPTKNTYRVCQQKKKKKKKKEKEKEKEKKRKPLLLLRKHY